MDAILSDDVVTMATRIWSIENDILKLDDAELKLRLELKVKVKVKL